jgi:hypothetical protein
VRPLFKATPTPQDAPVTLSARLPMAVPPSQVPKLASAGLALSPYVRADDYSSTQPRQCVLWLEFEHPVENPRDAYVARVLAYAPDPMLVEREPQEPPGPAEPPLPIDPELIRVITPGQSDDRAGLDAMQQLTKSSSSDRHFILPLPPGLSEDSLELFGFFVYELRVEHAEGWSTAQGRFGPALRVTGVQHPTPVVTCSASRESRGITVSAPYATPVFEGRNLLPLVPKTEIWVLLYAQVTQVRILRTSPFTAVPPICVFDTDQSAVRPIAGAASERAVTPRAGGREGRESPHPGDGHRDGLGLVAVPARERAGTMVSGACWPGKCSGPEDWYRGIGAHATDPPRTTKPPAPSTIRPHQLQVRTPGQSFSKRA